VDSAGGWVQFRRSDPAAVVNMVRAVAGAADPGEHGDGVEVVICAPQLGFWARLFRDRTPDQARVVVTAAGGEVTYPFSVQLVTDEGRTVGALARLRARRKVRKIPARSGWARSNSAGLSFLVQKGWSDVYEWGDLVDGAISAISALTRKLPDAGWRATVDRAVKRT